MHFHRIRNTQHLVHILIKFVNDYHGRLQSHHIEKRPANLIQRLMQPYIILLSIVSRLVNRISRRQPTCGHQVVSLTSVSPFYQPPHGVGTNSDSAAQ